MVIEVGDTNLPCLQSKEKSGPNTQSQAKGKKHKHTPRVNVPLN